MLKVLSIQVGRPTPLGPDGVLSGFVKRAVHGPVRARVLDLDGDEQADLSVHGGPEKAVYFYASEHYPKWVAEHPEHEGILQPGGFGENITTTGLDEDSVAIGDVLAVGSVQFQVTQPRQPCFKLGLRFADNRMGKAMMQTGRSGWYVRVLQTGELQAGDAITVLRRPNPEWTIRRMNELLLHRAGTTEELRSLAAAEGLAQHWIDEIRESLGE